MTYTYTYVIVNVSPSTYQEIRRHLEIANYQHAFHDEGDGEVIDLHGLALRAVEDEEDSRRMSKVQISRVDAPRSTPDAWEAKIQIKARSFVVVRPTIEAALADLLDMVGDEFAMLLPDVDDALETDGPPNTATA